MFTDLCSIFNKFIENNYSSLIIVYFYETSEWCTSLTDKLDNVFAQNCNGNTKILKIDLATQLIEKELIINEKQKKLIKEYLDRRLKREPFDRIMKKKILLGIFI